MKWFDREWVQILICVLFAISVMALIATQALGH